jgi:hypothetical protein
MKNNRKNRALCHIRKKNKLRCGIYKFHYKAKISKELIEDIVEMGHVAETIIKDAYSSLYRQYKLGPELNKCTIELIYEDNDWIRDTATVLITLRAEKL